MIDEMFVTVFTPTYNRGYILTKAYESLKNQTNKNFEWIIVDDGSTDNTNELVRKWQIDNNNFKLKYYFQKNSGKHIAINYAVKVANGELFLILDSDDFLRADAIELIINYSKDIKKLPSYGGIVFNRAYFNGKIIGSTFNGKYKDITFFEREKNGITGDKVEVVYTEILKKYPFPKFENEKFCTEAIVWNRMAKDKIIFRFVNENIYFTEYLEDGLTRKYQKLMEENPRQSYMFFLEYLKYNSLISIKNRILYLINLLYFAEKTKQNNKLKLNRVLAYLIAKIGKFYRFFKYQIK